MQAFFVSKTFLYSVDYQDNNIIYISKIEPNKNKSRRITKHKYVNTIPGSIHLFFPR